MLPSKIKPAPISNIVLLSGTADALPATCPLTSLPNCVPNPNTTPLATVAEVMAESEIVNVAVSSRNGLCGPLPVIELFAFVYGPAPMIRWDGGGAVGAGVPPSGHITQMTTP